MPAIRVAHLIHSMAYGGVETALINWCKTFDPEKVEVYLICFANPGGTELPFIEAANRVGLKVDTIPWSRNKPIWQAARRTSKLLIECKIELLHCHNTYANIVGLIAAKLNKVHTLTTIYVWSGYGLKRRILQWIDVQLLRFFDQITAHCESARDATIQRGIDAKQIQLLTCGFTERVVHMSSADRESERSKMGVASEDIVLIKVARFWPEKRHDVLLQAFQLLLKQHLNFRLWIPGVGPLQYQTMALAKELGINDRCHFLGFRNDLPELLALADIQIHSSDEEGVPLAILSGMAAGKPIVSTSVGGIPEVIKHGISGILVQASQPQLLADAVFSVSQDSQLQSRLGLAAQQFIKTEYSLSAATSKVEQLYSEIVKR